MDKNLLNRYTANQCSPKEIDEFFNWVEKHPEEKAEGNPLFRNYWNNIEMADTPDIESSQKRLDRIHHIINLNQARQKVAKDFAGRKVKLTSWFSKAAAILLIPVLTLFVYTRFFQSGSYLLSDLSQDIEIVAPPASRIQFELSDGTKVWLNQGSKMIYSQPFTGKTRTVNLVGEGYFDVAPDKIKPFIVETQKMAVKAVGTSFNVKAYADNPYFETTLESGKVIISTEVNGSSKEICTMSPSEQFVLNETTNKYSLKEVNPEKYVSWKDGLLMFQDDRLDEVAERLSRWYNVKITLKDSELSSLTYTATFIDETLEQALEMMKFVLPVSFTVSNKYKLPDSTFSEKEILIYKKGGKTN